MEFFLGVLKKNIRCMKRFALAIALIFSFGVGLFLPVTNLARVEAASVISIKYDDRYSFKSNVVFVVTESVTSYQLDSSKKDEAVLKKDASDAKTVIACGCGRAKVLLENKKVYSISVTPAKISLLLLVGQSNMEGALITNTKKNRLRMQKQCIRCPEGTVYNTYAPSSAFRFTTIGWYGSAGTKDRSIYNVKRFIPSSLTDNSSKYKWKRTNNLTTAEDAVGKSGVDAGIGYQWYKSTGEKVWLINCAKSGTAISEWQPGEAKSDNLFWQSVVLYQEAEKLLNKEIAAKHFVLSKKGIYWCQGEQDTTTDATTYDAAFHTMLSSYETELSGSETRYVNHGLDFVGILMVRSYAAIVGSYFSSGARTALYQMCHSTSSENAKIYLASDIEEQWTTDEAVKNYFKNKYKSASNYNAKNPTTTTLSLPKKVSEVFGNNHFSQRARNEIGRDAALNIIRKVY